jgi:prepilin-type processing-associated H-X9-DG protein
MSVLLQKGYITSTRAFICPSGNQRVPVAIQQMDPRKITKQQLVQFNCYAYATGIGADWPAGAMVVHDIHSHRNGGRNVGFKDGHVEWVPEWRFRRMMEDPQRAAEQR